MRADVIVIYIVCSFRSAACLSVSDQYLLSVLLLYVMAGGVLLPCYWAMVGKYCVFPGGTACSYWYCISLFIALPRRRLAISFLTKHTTLSAVLLLRRRVIEFPVQRVC